MLKLVLANAICAASAYSLTMLMTPSWLITNGSSPSSTRCLSAYTCNAMRGRIG